MNIRQAAGLTLSRHKIKSHTETNIVLQGIHGSLMITLTQAEQGITLDFPGGCRVKLFAHKECKTLRDKIEWIGDSSLDFIGEKYAGEKISVTTWDQGQKKVDIGFTMECGAGWMQDINKELESDYHQALISAGANQAEARNTVARVTHGRLYLAHSSCSRATDLFKAEADAADKAGPQA